MKKKILIIGGSGSIGSSIARALLNRFEVIVIDKRKSDLNVDHFILSDFSNYEILKSYLTEKYSNIDVVIFANGNVLFKELTEIDDSEFQELIYSNFVLTFRALKLTTSLLHKSANPYIINIGSISEDLDFVNNGAYSATKLATSKMLKVFALENPNIKVTNLITGAVKSDFWKKYPEFKLEKMLDSDLIGEKVLELVNSYERMYCPVFKVLPVEGIL